MPRCIGGSIRTPTRPAFPSRTRPDTFLDQNKGNIANFPCILQRKRRLFPCNSTKLDSQTAELLDRFWEARGVFNGDQRKQLVEVAEGMEEEGDEQLDEGEALPGISYYWMLDTKKEQVAAVSRRLIRLQALLGDQADIDVVWMCVREPNLLTANYQSLLQRLLDMKLSNSGDMTNIVKVVERQPALLLQDDAKIDKREAPQDQLPAWEFGLVSDKDDEWARRFGELVEYRGARGDVHVGFRDADDPELDRWCEKQREACKRNLLSDAKQGDLEKLGFEFSRENAEWLRWFSELTSYQGHTGNVSPMTLASGTNFMLINWCSVQRVAMRSGVLSPQREEMLNSIGFDWTAADALS